MKYILNALMLTLLLSCGAGNETPDKDETETNVEIYKKWELSVLNGEKVFINTPIYIELSKDNKLSGFVGCNNLTGTYVVENGNQIKFSQIGTTRMACPEKEMNLESQVLDLLNTTDNFTIEDGKLMLNNNEKTPLATFYEMSNSEIVNKYWKLIKLEGDSVQMAENQEREQYFTLRSDGSISGFAACNHFNGQYELDEGNRISFSENMAVTLKICPDVDVDESAFLEVFSIADNYTINSDVLNLNVGKRAPLAVFGAVYF